MGSKASIMPRQANEYSSDESDASVDDYAPVGFFDSELSDASSESGGANDVQYEVHSIQDIRINRNNNQVSIVFITISAIYSHFFSFLHPINAPFFSIFFIYFRWNSTFAGPAAMKMKICGCPPVNPTAQIRFCAISSSGCAY